MIASSDPMVSAESSRAALAEARGMDGRPLAMIVGPTAVGKTALSLDLALALDGEITSADSRLFYRGMDIGTAKPSRDERARVPHHLIDIAEPDETVGLGQFCELATRAIDGIRGCGRLPLLVGGTGQYVRALVEGWRIPRVPPDPELRRDLEGTAAREGGPVLYARLVDLDPGAAAGIDPRNVRRVIRALEVCLVTGSTVSELRGRQRPLYRVLQIGLTMSREQLYDRADRRLEGMFSQGLEAEVRSLVERGFSFRLPSMSALGYAQFEPYFSGEAGLDDVFREVKRSTRRLIRQQYSWFRLDDQAIRWFDASRLDMDEVLAVVRRWLGEQPVR